jgi:hypothetical protein
MKITLNKKLIWMTKIVLMYNLKIYIKDNDIDLEEIMYVDDIEKDQ